MQEISFKLFFLTYEALSNNNDNLEAENVLFSFGYNIYTQNFSFRQPHLVLVFLLTEWQDCFSYFLPCCFQFRFPEPLPITTHVLPFLLKVAETKLSFSICAFSNRSVIFRSSLDVSFYRYFVLLCHTRCNQP